MNPQFGILAKERLERLAEELETKRARRLYDMGRPVKPMATPPATRALH